MKMQCVHHLSWILCYAVEVIGIVPAGMKAQKGHTEWEQGNWTY